jgi:hypothetical protein
MQNALLSKTAKPLAIASYAPFMGPLNAIDQRRASEVFGYLELGLPEMATSSLGGVEAPIQSRADLEYLRLLALEQAGTPMGVLAELAWQSLERHQQCFRILEMAHIYLTGAEQYDRVLWLYETYRSSPMMTGNLLQTVTAAAANLGQFKLALQLAVQAVQTLTPASAVLMDSQILPLWTRYTVAPLDAEEGALLRSPELTKVLASAQAGPPPGGICPFTLKHLLPKVFHPWMQTCPDAAYRPQSGTPKAIRLAFFHWQDSRRRRNLRLLRRAIQRAQAQLPRHPRLRMASGQALG